MNVKNTASDQIELPAAAQSLQPKKSLSDIADMLAQQTLSMRGQTPNEVNDNDDNSESEADAANLDPSNRRTDEEHAEHLEDTDELGDGGGTDDELDEGREEEDTQESSEDGGDEEENDTLDADANDADQLEFEIDDTDVMELEDGTQVTIADLKRVYQADETITQAVQEQQEATTEALTMRARAQEDANKAQGAVNAMLKHVVDVVTAPLISKPDPSLKTSNPEQYIKHLDAYQQDQERIQAAQQDLAGAVEAFSTQQAELIEARKKDEMGILVSKLPALQKQETRAQASQDILDAASYYGFSPEEVNNAIDHRVYQMAHDAQQYRKLISASGKEEVDLTLEKAKTKVRQTRTLRSRGTTAKSRVSGQAKRVLKAKKAAIASGGKPKDVAAFLAAKRQKP